MIETGTILQNRYRVEKQIGQGGMGKVYVATDERFKSVVAIKQTVFEDKNLRKAFEREARLLNSFRHPALPRVSDHFDENDGQFLVMEYIAGDDLAEMMERDGAAFPLEKVLNWADQLCDALDYLHAQNIIHRDIKPQNLKLTPNGQIVLLDFGLAKGNPTDAQHQTAAKSIFGYSRSYASLEQIQGTGTEPRSDLYSLSATLYHLLTGMPPVDALTRAMNVLNGQSDPLIEANVINRKVPRGVAKVLQSAMALNAGERPASAAEMREKLEESDKTINAVDEENVSDKKLTADLLTQETKIMTAATNAANAGQSKIKTLISSSDAPEKNPHQTKIEGATGNSIVTKVQPANENTKDPNRRRTFGASVFGGLLLTGIAASAFYFYNPGVSQTNNGNAVGNIQGTFAPVQQNANIAVAANALVSNDNTKLAEDTGNASQESPKKTVETAGKNNKPTNNQAGNSAGNDKSKKRAVGNDEIMINENGETVETKDMIINENGITFKHSPKPPRRSKGNPPAPDTTYFSPEEIQKLKELGNKRVIVVKPPAPQSTP